MVLIPCPNCGAPRQRGSTRCTTCTWTAGRPALRTNRHKRAAAAAVAAHRRRHGDVCPGWQRPPHPARDLTADHPHDVVTGGAEDQELVVLCRSCNSAKGAAAREAARVGEGRRCPPHV